MRTTKTLAAVWALSVLTIALPARAADYPETPDGLKNLNEDILAALKAGEKEKAAALVKGLVLVDHAEWLKKTFGEELGTKIDAGYAKVAASLEADGVKLYEAQLKQNRTNVTAYKLTDPDDKQATGAQRDALTAMKVKVPLYGVRLIEPGKDAGMHLWNFVYVDNGWRMIGKLPTK